jgi:NAD(P)-dependent dehydrogenase (short-subunit alcohol dehydrogenase family)
MADKTVLVTGAAGALGSAVTSAFLDDGWRVVGAGRPGSAARLAPGAVPAEADLADPAGAASAARVAAAEPAAPLRAVVNLVGGFAAGGRVHETPVTELEGLFALNLRPTYLVTSATLPYLIAAGGGAVVCVSSRAAQHPFPGASGYITAKAALLGFAGAVAAEYARDGVRCNTVLPGLIDTPANRAGRDGGDRTGLVPPAEIARVICFLAGDGSAPTTGAAVPVHGLR